MKLNPNAVEMCIRDRKGSNWMNSRRPLILIAPSDHTFDTEYERRPKFELYKNYARAVYAAGGIPIMCVETDLAAEYAEICDGLVVPGGGGIHPSCYGGDVYKRQLFNSFQTGIWKAW